MKRSWLLPSIAILGVVIAVIAVIDTNRKVAVPAPAVQPAQAPFPSFVAGSGITGLQDYEARRHAERWNRSGAGLIHGFPRTEVIARSGA